MTALGTQVETLRVGDRVGVGALCGWVRSHHHPRLTLLLLSNIVLSLIDWLSVHVSMNDRQHRHRRRHLREHRKAQICHCRAVTMMSIVCLVRKRLLLFFTLIVVVCSQFFWMFSVSICVDMCDLLAFTFVVASALTVLIWYFFLSFIYFFSNDNQKNSSRRFSIRSRTYWTSQLCRQIILFFLQVVPAGLPLECVAPLLCAYDLIC